MDGKERRVRRMIGIMTFTCIAGYKLPLWKLVRKWEASIRTSALMRKEREELGKIIVVKKTLYSFTHRAVKSGKSVD